MTCCNNETDAFAFETITVSSTAIGPTEATRDGDADIAAAQRALVSIENASVRYRYDGTNPTASVGHLAPAGEVFAVEGSDNIAKLKMIRTGSTDASASVTYER